MTKERALQLIIESFEKLKKIGMVVEDVPLNNETVLLGGASSLDSIGFVTFLTDLEERIIKETHYEDLYLVLNEISEFNIDKPELSAEVLAQYIVKLSGGK